jgi:hypothetical protein
MILTKHSQELASFFIQNNCINHEKNKPKTREILTILYNQIKNTNNDIKNIKFTKQLRKVSVSHTSIKPSSFDLRSFPETIIEHIDSTASIEMTYNFSLKERNITVHFILENSNDITNCDKHINLIIHLMCILNIYSNKMCSKKLTIFIYMTSLQKELPKTNAHVLDQTNVNTAFTRTCMHTAEIVIFRKEEWFKVLIHESFHNFGLDFADMNNNECHAKILRMFKVSSEVNLFEAYTEFWAEILNACLCSFLILQNKNDVNEFLLNVDFFINFERTYSFFQLVKTLDFMGVTYTDLYSSSLKNSNYKEKSNILAYYIIKTILIHNFQDFLSWCQTHNTSLLQFNKEDNKQIKMCNFIEQKYMSNTLLNNIYKTDTLFRKCKGKNRLSQNMRMTMFELG